MNFKAKTFQEALDDYREDERFTVNNKEDSLTISWTDSGTAMWKESVKQLKTLGGFKDYYFALEGSTATVKFLNRKVKK